MTEARRYPVLKRLAWFAGIWLTSVALLALVATLLRWLLRV